MTTIKEANGNPCSVCGIDELPHAQAEAIGKINHRWTTTGELIPVDRTARSRTSQPRPQIMVVGAIDTNLRALLHQKGILNDEDLATLFNAGTSAEGDRGTGSTESP